jgi:hypothetical protein
LKYKITKNNLKKYIYIYYTMPKKSNKNTIMNVNNQNWFINNENMEHFKTLDPLQQEAVKQRMLLKYLEIQNNQK